MKLFALTFLSLSVLIAGAQEHYMLVGTYDSPKSEGVYVYKFNSVDGTAQPVSHIKTSNPSFIAVSPDERFVYAVQEVAPQGGKGGDVAAFSFDKKTGTLQFISRMHSGGDHPCHIEMDRTGKWLFASNYTSGTLGVLAVANDGSLGEPNIMFHAGSSIHPQRQKGPHIHCAKISADNKSLFVTDLGSDKLIHYHFDPETRMLTEAKKAFLPIIPGSGPRSFTFHPSYQFAYLIEELSGTVVVYRNKGKKLKPLQRISTMLPADTLPANSADVHASPDGKFLYASNRGDVNSIAIYRIAKNGKLTYLSHQSTLGKTPRNFSIDPSGNYLLCENQNSDEIVIFKRDVKTGLLSDTGNRISVGKPVCIKWISIN